MDGLIWDVKCLHKGRCGRSSLKKGSEMSYLRASYQLFYVQHQTPYPLPQTYIAGRFSVVPNVWKFPTNRGIYPKWLPSGT